MIDLDNGPLVFGCIIAVVFTFPAIYGMLFVDTYWKQHQQEGGNDDVFN